MNSHLWHCPLAQTMQFTSESQKAQIFTHEQIISITTVRPSQIACTYQTNYLALILTHVYLQIHSNRRFKDSVFIIRTNRKKLLGFQFLSFLLTSSKGCNLILLVLFANCGNNILYRIPRYSRKQSSSKSCWLGHKFLINKLINNEWVGKILVKVK